VDKQIEERAPILGLEGGIPRILYLKGAFGREVWQERPNRFLEGLLILKGGGKKFL